MKAAAICLLIAMLAMDRLSIVGWANSDLAVHTNTAPASASRGSIINVSDVITNRSGTVQAGPSVTCMYMNTNRTIVGASNLGTHSTASIGPRGKISWSGTVTVPSTQPTGQNYFITVCDCLNNVTESNENNNTNSCPITINP